MFEELIKACVGCEPLRRVETLDDYGLGGIDCELCGNTGTIMENRDGIWYGRECECMKKRRSMRSIRNSGMADMLSRYTFESYEAFDEKRKNIVTLAKRFAKKDDGWFFISGRSGSGKSHICTAICKELIEKNVEVRYMLWRDESAAIKACVTEADEYGRRIQKLKTVPVLYIDDFWKGGVSDADVRLSFEILNARYCDTSKRTIISSELPLSKIVEIDEAVGSRIFERSRGYRIAAPNENYRLRE